MVNNKNYVGEEFIDKLYKNLYMSEVVQHTKDNKDKTYAWYEQELDISELEKGTYTILVYSKTSNAEDYGEISDMFEELNEQVTINGKEYKITYNPNRQNRLELIIK